MRAPVERLTQREFQVAVLVADGLSDREIADRLVITRRTAEWHVQQILAKLSLKSRTQIAVRVAEAEALGFPIPGAGRLGRKAPPERTAFVGWNPDVTETHELLTTTRMLDGPPLDTDAERRERLVALAEAGYNPVIVRFTYAVALGKVALRYPKTQFAIIDDSSLPPANKNVTSLVFADHQGSYLVGAIAAQASKAACIGFVGGVQCPFIERFEAGYAAGARAVNHNINVQVCYLTEPPDFSGFADAGKARAAALEMYQRGADVVYHAAGGAGTGVFEAAKLAGTFAIGVDSDQYATAPADTKASILTSMLKHQDMAVNEYLHDHARKSLRSRVYRFDLGTGGVDYSKTNPLVQPYVPMTEDFRHEILAGRITVPERAG